MGCIEIALLLRPQGRRWQFNRNMGCIEICGELIELVFDSRLIETWDVLKYIYAQIGCDRGCCLIETWDVLKFSCMNKTAKTSIV